MKNLLDQIREDIQVNRGQSKGQVVVVCYRVAHAVRQPLDQKPKLLALPVGIAYRLIVEWVLGVEIPWSTRIGRRLRIFHGIGIVINDQVTLGDDVQLRQGITIGNSGKDLACPQIGDNVTIGASAIIVGGIKIGDNATINAGALVTKDVPQGGYAKGNPSVIQEPRTTLAPGEARLD